MTTPTTAGIVVRDTPRLVECATGHLPKYPAHPLARWGLRLAMFAAFGGLALWCNAATGGDCSNTANAEIAQRVSLVNLSKADVNVVGRPLPAGLRSRRPGHSGRRTRPGPGRLGGRGLSAADGSAGPATPLTGAVAARAADRGARPDPLLRLHRHRELPRHPRPDPVRQRHDGAQPVARHRLRRRPVRDDRRHAQLAARDDGAARRVSVIPVVPAMSNHGDQPSSTRDSQGASTPGSGSAWVPSSSSASGGTDSPAGTSTAWPDMLASTSSVRPSSDLV